VPQAAQCRLPHYWPPAAVSTAIEIVNPAGNCGQKNFTSRFELYGIATFSPFAFTVVPPSSSDAPVGSVKTLPGDASQVPTSQAIAPGLHVNVSPDAKTGIPGPTSVVTSASADFRNKLVAETGTTAESTQSGRSQS
jgi:hypothetical protein